MGQPRPLFCSFQALNLQKKTVEINGIRTRIVGVKGGHADSLTTTTAQSEEKFMKRFRGKEMKIRERSKSEKRIKRERQNVIKGTREKRNSFQSNNTIFTTNQCEKMSKCPTPGFEPTTFRL